MVIVGASSNLDLNSDFEQPQHISTTIASMDNAFQKRSNTTVPYSPTEINENEDCYSNSSLDLDSMNFTLTGHTQLLPGFDISGNENSANVRNDVSTGSMIENEDDFSKCPVDWDFTTRSSLKIVDKTQTGLLGQDDLSSSGGTTLVLENLDSETRDEVLNVLFRHRRRIAFRIE